MPKKEISLFEQIRTNAHLSDNCSLFYDWFCKDTSLPRKAKTLMGMVRKIAFSQKFDATKTYVFFKNNCPMMGSLYDDFRICELETGDVLYTVSPRNAFEKGKCTVYGRENDFDEPLIIGTAKEVVDWFNN